MEPLTSDLCSFVTESFSKSSRHPQEVTFISPASVKQSYEASVVKYCAENIQAKGVFIDAGAHIGFYSLPLSGIFEMCYAFEPSDFQYNLLCKNIEQNKIKNVKPLKFGLGSLEEQKDFYITGKSGGTNTFLRNQYSENPMETRTVQLKTLDSFAINNVSMIKIDVEGWELEVLKGSLDTINQSNPEMLIEVWENSARRTEIHELLAKLNYKIEYRFQDFPELGWASRIQSTVAGKK
jgi:FkbM family methyltransferase